MQGWPRIVESESNTFDQMGWHRVSWGHRLFRRAWRRKTSIQEDYL